MTTKTRYRAVIELDGKRFVVFPRSKKTSLFESIKSASQGLERFARNLSADSRGIVTDTLGETVFTIAL